MYNYITFHILEYTLDIFIENKNREKRLKYNCRFVYEAYQPIYLTSKRYWF